MVSRREVTPRLAVLLRCREHAVPACGTGEPQAGRILSLPGKRQPRPGNDGDEKAGLMLLAPVQGATAFGAFVVGGWELAGERMTWP